MTTKQFLGGMIKSENTFTNLLVLLFFLLGLAGICNHAMWRDEINGWLIVRDSTSFVNLFQNIKYEGHPALWYLCLYVLIQFTHDPFIMQIFHLLLATGFVYLFVKFSPFTRGQKFLFVFGYLPFYEYLLISRNYAIEVLLLFGFCTLFQERWKRPLLMAIVLFLLANTNAYGFLISLALAATLLFEYWLGGATRPGAKPASILLANVGLYSIGAILSFIQLLPAPDNTLAGGASGWTFGFDLNHFFTAATRIWSGYIVVLVPNDAHAWEMVLFTVPAVGMVVYASLLLIRKPCALFLYLTGTLGIFLLTYVKFIGSARHFGHFYVVLILSLWIASYYSDSDLLIQTAQKFSAALSRTLNDWAESANKHKGRFITLILVCQFVGGLVAFIRDLTIPYSASRDAARFIQSKRLDRMFIAGSRDYAISPLCGYLDRKIYYPESRQVGSFILFTGKRIEVDEKEVLAQVSELAAQKNQEILLIRNQQLSTQRAELKVTPVAQFTNSFINEEIYYLYKVSRLTQSTRKTPPSATERG